MPAEQGLFALGVQIQNVAEELKKLEALEAAAVRVKAKLDSLGKAKSTAIKLGFAGDFEKSFAEISKFATKLEQSAARQQASIKNLTSSYRDAINNAKALKKELVAAADSGTTALGKTGKSMKDFNSLMGVAIGKIIRYRIAFGLWREITDMMREMVEVTIAMNQQITELTKVMDPVTTNFKYLASVAFDLGKRFGVSALEVAKSMVIWAQQGKDMVEVAQLTEATLLGVNAANLSVMESVEALTAATKSYNIEAKDSASIVDKWMAVQAKHAVTAQDLANAVQTIGSAAAIAGVGLDELNGVVASIGSTTRKTGREVANSFKTMLARMTRMPTVSVFQNLGIAVMQTATQMRPMPTILADLSRKWNTLDKSVKENIAVTVGGIRRYSDFIVLMDHFQEFIDGTSDSFNALGEAQVASRSQVESYQSQIQRLKTVFEQLGVAVGESGVLQVIINLSKVLMGMSGALKVIGPLFVVGAKFITLWGGALAAAYLTMAAGKGLLLIHGKLWGGLKTQILGTIVAIKALTTANLAANRSLAMIGTAVTGVVRAFSAIAGIAVGLYALFELFKILFTKVEETGLAFKELSDEMLANVHSASNIADAYAQDVKELKLLVDEKKRFVLQAKQMGGAVDAEAFATQRLIETYPDLVKKYAEFVKEYKDGTLQYDISTSTMEAVLARYESKHTQAYDNMIQVTKDALKSHETELEGFKDTILRIKGDIDSIISGGLLDPNKMIVGRGVKGGFSTGLTALQWDFSKFWNDLKDSLTKSIDEAQVEQHVKDDLIDRLRKAFEAMETSDLSDKAREAFKNTIVDVLAEVNNLASKEASKLQQIVDDLMRQLSGQRKVMLPVADAYYFVLARATRLGEELAKLRKESSLFERDNVTLERSLKRAGIGFDETAAAVSFYKSKLEGIFDLRAAHELELAMQEQRVAMMDIQDVSEQAREAEELKLDTLRREKQAVSSNYEAYKIGAIKIQADASKQLEVLEKQAKANEYNADAVEEIKQKMIGVREATEALYLKNLKVFEILANTKGAYGKLVAEQIRYEELLRKAIDAQLIHMRLVEDEKRAFNEIKLNAEGQVELANLRSAAEKDVLAIQQKSVDKQLEYLRIQLNGMLPTDKGRVEVLAEILALENEQLKLGKQYNQLAPKRTILQQQSAITIEMARQEAITDVMVANLSLQAHSEFKVLEMEKERATTMASIEELNRSSLGLGMADADVIARRQALTLKLLDIEKQIYLERIKIIKEYRDQLDQVSGEMRGIISSGLGGWLEKQIAAYEELGTIQQQIADAERDRQIALQEGNDEALWDANKSLSDLRDRQSELNSATYQWLQTLVDIGKQLASMINQKLAEQFINNLMEISSGTGGMTIGQSLAKGIVLKPDLAEFKILFTEVSASLKNPIVEAGVFVGDYIKNSIISGFSGVGFGTATPGIASVGTATAAATSALDATTIMKDGITQGGIEAGSQMKTDIITAGREAGASISGATVTAGDVTASKLDVALRAGAQLLGNTIGTYMGGGGPGAGMGASLAGMIPGIAGLAGPAGAAATLFASIVGGLLGGLFDKQEELVQKPIFDTSKPMPVTIEGINRKEVMLHDISISVEANFLDPSQLDPIAMRNLAEHVRKETEDLLKRENMWGD